jgi:hypothetical protein
VVASHRTLDQAAPVAARPGVGESPRGPKDPDAERGETEACGDAQQAGEVVTGRACLARVVQRLAAGDESEESGQERKRRLHAPAEPREREDGERERRERHDAAGQMVAGGRGGLRLHEGVVGDVQGDGARRDGEQRGAPHGIVTSRISVMVVRSAT